MMNGSELSIIDKPQTIRRLETIISLKIGDKLGVNEDFYISPNFLSRYWNNEDRMNTVTRLETFYFDLLPRTVTDMELSHLLWRSLHGLERLRETYSEDMCTVTRIDCLLSEIKRKKIELAQAMV